MPIHVCDKNRNALHDDDDDQLFTIGSTRDSLKSSKNIIFKSIYFICLNQELLGAWHGIKFAKYESKVRTGCFLNILPVSYLLLFISIKMDVI
jgi:hypothetical protein